jgi:hypothetical protein
LLKRFVDVCDAVEYAHSRGVLHRDLKPQNVMLGKYGETLIVDWGLAKVIGRQSESDQDDDRTLRPSSASGTTPTLHGSAHGTIGYMSPEQATGRVSELGRATDVYSLGSILYTVLTGKPTFHPSQDSVLEKIARGDFVHPRSLDRTIPRPLEAICLKALATKPADRYQAAVHISRDIERWLADEPVSVYAEPLLDRALRTVRRHRTAFVGGTAILLSSLLALAVIAVIINRQNNVLRTTNERLRIARNEAETNRLAAEAQRTKADEAADRARHASSVSIAILDNFVKGLADDKWAQLPQFEAERIKMVDLAVQRYSHLLDEMPEDQLLKADVVQVLVRSGNLYRMTGKHEKAQQQIERAIAIIDELPSLAGDDTKVGLLSDTLSALTDSTVLLRGAREAYPVCDRNLAIARQRLKAQPDSLLAMLGLGRVLLQRCELSLELSQPAAAEQDAREAATVFRRLSTPLDSQFVIHVFHSYAHTLVGRACLVQSKLSEAKSAIDEATTLGDAALARFAGNNNVRDFAQKSVVERGNYRLATGEVAAGTADLAGSLEVYRDLSRDFPQIDAYRRMQVQLMNRLATQSLKDESESEAADFATQSLQLLRQLAGDEPLIARYLPLQIEALAVRALTASADDAMGFRNELEVAQQALTALNSKHPVLAEDLLKRYGESD